MDGWTYGTLKLVLHLSPKPSNPQVQSTGFPPHHMASDYILSRQVTSRPIHFLPRLGCIHPSILSSFLPCLSFLPPSLVPGEQQHDGQEGGEGQQAPEQWAVLLGDGHLRQVVGDLRDLVRHAHEDESADDDVERGVAGHQHQDALGVGCQPDVVLADEQLEDTSRSENKRQ